MWLLGRYQEGIIESGFNYKEMNFTKDELLMIKEAVQVLLMSGTDEVEDTKATLLLVKLEREIAKK